MTLRRTAVAGVAALCLLAGCGDGSHRPSGSAATAGPGIDGVLRDKAGATLDHAEVLACMATTCLFGTTDGHGRFAFAVDPPPGAAAEVAIKTREDPGAVPPRGSALCPVRVEGSSRVDVGNVFFRRSRPARGSAWLTRTRRSLALGQASSSGCAGVTWWPTATR